MLILSHGTPLPTHGNDGDYALDIDNLIFFGPKKAAAWATRTPLVATRGNQIEITPTFDTPTPNKAKIAVFYDPTGGAGNSEYSEVAIVAQNALGGNSGIIDVYKDGESPTQCDFTMSVITMPNLPTADPHVVGQLWNNAGSPKISAGP